MNSVATKHFWTCFDKLPPPIQRQAEISYRLWKDNPHHRSLEFADATVLASMLDELFSCKSAADTAY